MDSVAAHETPGIFGHVRAFLGVVEPQMRKALHIHMLIQLLGFAHPADLFGGDVLPNVFRRLWYFVASICFRSTEGFAAYLDVDAAMQSLQQEPLLPLTKKQRGMIGEVRSQASAKAQLEARGLHVLPSEPQAYTPMSYISSTIHKDVSVDEHAWSSRCVKLVASSTRKSGNHVCRPDVCHKGPLGKKGFCRMLFWHWARHVDDKKKLVAKRSHGRSLHPRWNGTGCPPIHEAPPLLGSPALETTHPFHFKMTPSVLLGPTCNHDLGVLLRLGKSPQQASLVGAAQQKQLKERSPAHASHDHNEDAISSMLTAMGDHEHYCAAYSAKDQPHVEGLLMTLVDSLRFKERDLLEAKENGEDLTPHETSRRLLHTLLAATNRRMHKGFPEMLTYLLRKPMEYCSHRFVSLKVDGRLRHAIALTRASVVGDTFPSHENPRDAMVVADKCELKVIDYSFRPEALDSCPLYFFMAACVAHPNLNSRSMDWKELHMNPTSLADPPLLARQQSYQTDMIMSKLYPKEPLRDGNLQPLHKYLYYVRLLTHEPWRVPVFYGRLPRVPTETSTPYDKGIYGLFLMIVFRPHRLLQDLVSAVSASASPKNEDEAWSLLYQDFLCWRKEVDDRASKFRFVPNNDASSLQARPDIESLLASEPVFNTADWWACMTSDRLRNYEAAMHKHGTDMSAVPTEVDNLPVFHETVASRFGVTAEQVDNTFSPHEDASGDEVHIDAGDADCVQQKPPRSLGL